MKKFYSMALALTVAASALAAPQIRQIQPNVVKNHAAVSLAEGQMKKMSATKVKSYAGEENSIEGYYNFTIGDYYFETSQGQGVIPATITRDGSNITISSTSQFMPFDINGTFNASTNKLTFSVAQLGAYDFQNGATYYVKFCPFQYVEVGQQGQVNEITMEATFDPAAGTISFTADQGFGWKAYSGSNYAEAGFAGWLELWDALGMEKGVDPETGWTVVTEKAKWMDRMVAPMFNGESYVPTEKEITVQQNENDQHLYRMIAPFGDMMGDANIILDTTDEANVLIELQSTGIVTSDMGECYIASTSEILADPTQGNLITKNGNRIEFPAKSVWMFFPSYDQQSVYYNGGQTEPGYLVITGGVGVEDITIDANAPVEYYNMQGMRVANPEKGQLVIARQGEKAVKMIVK